MQFARGVAIRNAPTALDCGVDGSLWLVCSGLGGDAALALYLRVNGVRHQQKNTAMIPWSFRFFVLSIASAIFGFGGMAGDFVGIVEALFVVFLLLLMGAIIAQGLREKARAHHYFKPPSL